MPCDRCDGSREAGMRYCPGCGADLRDACPSCADYEARGSAYCGACGRALGEPAPAEPEEDPGDAAVRKALTLLVPVVGILLALELCYLVGGTLTVWDAMGSGGSLNVYLLVPNLIVATVLTDGAVQIAWVLLEIAILASVAAIAWQSWRAYAASEGGPVERIARTPFWFTCAMFSASITLSVVLTLLGMSTGNGITTPEWLDTGNTPDNLLSFASAAVWEEVIARIVPIGIPMTAAALILRRKGAWRWLFGGFGMSWLAVALIIISAVMFGFAHQSGWGIEKVLPTFASGLIFGYLFVKVGVHATIIMHFLTDYLAVLTGTGATLLVGLLEVAIILIGFVALAYLAKRLKGFFDGRADVPVWIAQDGSMEESRDSD